MESSGASFRVDCPMPSASVSNVDVPERAAIAATAGNAMLVLPHGAQVAVLHSHTRGALPIPLNFVVPEAHQALLMPYSGLINAKVTPKEGQFPDETVIFNKLKVERVSEDEHSKEKYQEQQQKRRRSREFILSLLWKIRHSFVQEQLTIFAHPLREKKAKLGHSEKPIPLPR
jgi:hypothetical protein